MLVRPVGDVDEGGGVVEPSRQEDTKDGAVGILGLGIGGMMLAILSFWSRGTRMPSEAKLTMVCSRGAAWVRYAMVPP